MPGSILSLVGVVRGGNGARYDNVCVSSCSCKSSYIYVVSLGTVLFVLPLRLRGTCVLKTGVVQHRTAEITPRKPVTLVSSPRRQRRQWAAASCHAAASWCPTSAQQVAFVRLHKKSTNVHPLATNAPPCLAPFHDPRRNQVLAALETAQRNNQNMTCYCSLTTEASASRSRVIRPVCKHNDAEHHLTPRRVPSCCFCLDAECNEE